MSDEVDRFLRETLAEATGGLDPELTQQALRAMQRAVLGQMQALEGAKYKRRRVQARCPGCRTYQAFTLPAADPEAVARAAAATTKAGDSIARLQEFLAGRPDSREDRGGLEWLRALTDEQVRVVQGWVEANTKGRAS